MVFVDKVRDTLDILGGITIQIFRGLRTIGQAQCFSRCLEHSLKRRIAAFIVYWYFNQCRSNTLQSHACALNQNLR